MSAWRVVCAKEILENLRDRRTMISVFVIGPLMGPVLFALLISLILSTQLEQAEKPLEVPVVGAEHAPQLIRHLKAVGVVVKDAPESPEEAVRKRDADVVLRIPEGFAESWREGESAKLELVLDSSQQKARASVTRLKSALQSYAELTASQRLLLRGVSPEVVRPLLIAEVDQSTPQSRAIMILSMLPYLLILTVFAGGSYLAIDTTAGERERQSLEPLLANPASRAELMSGKLVATTLFAWASLALSLVLFSLSSSIIPMDKLGMEIKLGVMECLKLFLIAAPLGIVGAAVMTIVAAFAKSFREAQTYMTFVILAPALPSMVMAINPLKPADWMYSVPLVSHQLLIEQTVRGEVTAWAQVALSVGVTVALGLVLAAVAARLYHRESLAISA